MHVHGCLPGAECVRRVQGVGLEVALDLVRAIVQVSVRHRFTGSGRELTELVVHPPAQEDPDPDGPVMAAPHQAVHYGNSAGSVDGEASWAEPPRRPPPTLPSPNHFRQHQDAVDELGARDGHGAGDHDGFRPLPSQATVTNELKMEHAMPGCMQPRIVSPTVAPVTTPSRRPPATGMSRITPPEAPAVVADAAFTSLQRQHQLSLTHCDEDRVRDASTAAVTPLPLPVPREAPVDTDSDDRALEREPVHAPWSRDDDDDYGAGYGSGDDDTRSPPSSYRKLSAGAVSPGRSPPGFDGESPPPFRRSARRPNRTDGISPLSPERPWYDAGAAAVQMPVPEPELARPGRPLLLPGLGCFPCKVRNEGVQCPVIAVIQVRPCTPRLDSLIALACTAILTSYPRTAVVCCTVSRRCRLAPW